MSSQFRTALAGAGVLTICVLLSLMKGHHILLTFAFGGIVCGLFSWLQYAKRVAARNNALLQFEEESPYIARRRASSVLEANVYQFPNQWQVSDASGS